MGQPTVAPYGSWKSPITSDLIVSATVGLGQIALDRGDTYWVELRPSEGGRNCVVARAPGRQTIDVTPPGFNARTRVHEYGGGDFVVSDGVVTFSNFADQCVYRQTVLTSPEPLTFSEKLRYSDFVMDERLMRIIAVREDHSAEGREAVNAIVSLSLIMGENRESLLVSGSDFYSSPRVSPDGSRLAWLAWNHPNMPWDGCEIWIGEIAAGGSIQNHKLVAGGARESIFQPEWSPDGVLYFVSDRTGWWNIYRAANGPVECLCEMDAEFAVPQWVFGLSTYSFASANTIVCAFVEKGIWKLGTINTHTKQFDRIETPYTEVSFVRAARGRAVFRAGSPNEPLSIVEMDLTSRDTKVLQRATKIEIDSSYISEPQPVEFPTENGLAAHGFYYPPKNRDFAASPNEKPLLLVN